MRIHQYWLNQYSTLCVAALLIALFGFALAIRELDLAEASAGAAFFAGPLPLISPRCIAGGVELTESELIVRGWLWSRRIPRDSITAISRFRVSWTSADGRLRRTPLTMFWNGLASWQPILDHNESAVERIRRWQEGRPPSTPRHRAPGTGH